MGRKKKVEEISDISEQLVDAAADGVITDDEIQDIVDGDSTDEEVVTTDDVSGDGEDTVAQEEIVEPESTPEVIEEPVVEETPEPEVKPEETPIVEETKEEDPVDTPESKFEEGVNYLNETSASEEEKVEWCLTMAPKPLRTIAQQLKSYNDAMKPGVPFDQSRQLAKQYELVNIYRSTFKATSYNEFKSKFDVLNLFFVVYAKEAFASNRLCRFDNLWKWSAKELETLLNVSEVVSQLCVYANRKEGIKKLNLEMALDSQKTIVSEDTRNNIIKYYSK